ncbi:MAG: hypothetical protein ACX930_05620 [Erythrobacter sp.]
MNSIRASLMACAALAAISATGAHASVDEYSVEANSRVTINIEVCSLESQLAVRGDAGTDLDFYLTDASGNSVITDEGVDDYFSVVIEKKEEECETYALGISNLGEEANTFTVVLEPVLADSVRVQKYIVQANATETIAFRACGTSARVSARGDGDTDLDFVIRNADGGIVHENDDTTDATSASLEGLLDDCEAFEMEVANLGEVYNALMVVIEPEGASAVAFTGTPPSTSLGEASVALAGGATPSPTVVAESSGAGDYQADANGSIRVDIPICGATRLEVRGDGDTDLDFTVTDEGGETVHYDIDRSDITFATLEPADNCETYALLVENLGDVQNLFTIELTDPRARGDTLGPGEYRVNASLATKVDMRVCDVTTVRARGDGDTDLDFEVVDTSGNTLHEDYDLTDATEFTLDPGTGCADFHLKVSNLGEVYNLLTVAFDDEAASAVRGARSGKTVSPAIATPGPPIGYAQRVPSPDGLDRSVTIINQTGETIELIYWANAATLDWGADKLGAGQVLEGDEEWSVNVFDGSNACLFNFRAVTTSEREIDLPGVNVCEEVSVAIE